MIRIPLERLLRRLAEEVGAVVADPATDPYARAQLQAAAEILRNLAPRVQWRRDCESDDEIQALLLQAHERPAGGNTSEAASRDAIMGLYRDVVARDDPESTRLRLAIEQLAGRQLERELSRLRR